MVVLVLLPDKYIFKPSEVILNASYLAIEKLTTKLLKISINKKRSYYLIDPTRITNTSEKKLQDHKYQM
jgi:hypothetical protein